MTDIDKRAAKDENLKKHSLEHIREEDSIVKRVKTTGTSNAQQEKSINALSMIIPTPVKCAASSTDSDRSSDSVQQQNDRELTGQKKGEYASIVDLASEINSDDAQDLKSNDIILQQKRKYFDDRVEAIKAEIESVESGVHEGMNSELKILESRKIKKILLAEQLHKHKLDSAESALASDIQFANDEHHSDAINLRKRVLKKLSKKQKRLEEQKRDFLLNDNGFSDTQRFSTRTLRRRGTKDNPISDHAANGRSIKKIPEIKVRLTDEEINYDLALIQKGFVNL